MASARQGPYELRIRRGPEEHLVARRMTLEVRDDPHCVELMTRFAAAHPDLWDEDIGE